MTYAYNSDLFDRSDTSEMRDWFLSLLKALERLADPEKVSCRSSNSTLCLPMIVAVTDHLLSHVAECSSSDTLGLLVRWACCS
jgi:hypothetical protein